MSTKGTLSNTIKSDSWYILPRTGIHINYTGHVPFWKVWSKITSAVKHYLQNRSKRKTEKERPQDHSKNKKYMYMCTCMYHMCMYMCITKRVRNFVFKNTTTEGVATERERKYTYFDPFLSPHPYSTWTRPDWTPVHYKTLQESKREGATKKRKTTTNHKQNNNTCTCENCDPMQLELSYIQIHTTEGTATERNREYTYCFASLLPHPYSIWTRPDWTQMRD